MAIVTKTSETGNPILSPSPRYNVQKGFSQNRFSEREVTEDTET